jgi:hypothetical protein
MSETNMDLNNMLTSNRVPKVTVTKLDNTEELMDDNEFSFLNMNGGAKGKNKTDDKSIETTNGVEESTPDVGAKRSIIRQQDSFAVTDKPSSENSNTEDENDNSEASNNNSFSKATSAEEIAKQLNVKSTTSSDKSIIPSSYENSNGNDNNNGNENESENDSNEKRGNYRN